jgi:putative serine protease PepD
VTDGVIITRISPEGPAYGAGLRAGDVIVSIDDIATPDMASFLTLLWSYEVGDVVQLEYASKNTIAVTSVELVERPRES